MHPSPNPPNCPHCGSPTGDRAACPSCGRPTDPASALLAGGAPQAGGPTARPGHPGPSPRPPIRARWFEKATGRAGLVGLIAGVLLVLYKFLWRSPEELPAFWQGRLFVFTVLPLFWGGLIALALQAFVLALGVWRQVRPYADPHVRRMRQAAGAAATAGRDRLPAGSGATAVSVVPSCPQPPGGALEVVYTLGAEDRVAHWVFRTEQTGAHRRLRAYRFVKWVVWLPLLALSVPGAVALAAGAWLLGDPVVMVPMGSGAVILLLLCGWLVRRRPEGLFREFARDNWIRDLRKKAAVLEREGVIHPARVHRLTIRPEGLTEVIQLRWSPFGLSVSESHETAATWGLLEEVVRTERHLFLSLGQGRGFWVPLRCFPDEQAASRFVRAAQTYQRAATRDRRAAGTAPESCPPSGPAHGEGS